MKIVLISSGVLPVPCPGYGGLEMIVADLAIELDKLGHEVYVVAPTESTIGTKGKIKLIDGGVSEPPVANRCTSCPSSPSVLARPQ